MTDAKQRITDLLDADQKLVSIVRTGSTDARTFYTVVRTWDHPEEPGMKVLNVQNAQLTADWSDMSDTFLSGGWRQRVPADDGTLLRTLAQELAGAAAAADAGTLGDRDVEVEDITGGEDGGD